MEENAQVDVGLQVPEEKMLPQTQVNDIVKREKMAAADRARREVEAEYMQRMQSQQMQPQAQGNAPNVDPEQMYSDLSARLMAEFERKQEEAMQARMEQERKDRSAAMAAQYFDKMRNGAELFEDFEEVLADFKPGAFPEVALLAGQLDNTAEVMYELAKNPSKLADINVLAKSDPEWAIKQLKKLSESIESNKQAMNVRSPNAPLSKIKSSNIGGVDAAPRSVDDLRRLAAFRG